ncbi:hypothetical protein DDE82_007269 [Stemphylium lycopersici]|nr:hypothetical protein DDE82_007269 [Stemphylium lycopersici]
MLLFWYIDVAGSYPAIPLRDEEHSDYSKE